MNIRLVNAGKRFNRDWIFRNFNHTFEAGRTYAITGPNGSGKSTLLQVIAGNIQPSEGSIDYAEEGLAFSKEASAKMTDSFFSKISIAAPYLETVEEMTAIEFLEFHISFKPFIPSITVEKAIEIIGLKDAAHKQIRFYSSGMKQRVKLAQAVFSDVPVLLLDEPCTNLDTAGYKLYQELIYEYCSGKLIIVSSNDINEYSFCKERISITDFK